MTDFVEQPTGEQSFSEGFKIIKSNTKIVFSETSPDQDRFFKSEAVSTPFGQTRLELSDCHLKHTWKKAMKTVVLILTEKH